MSISPVMFVGRVSRPPGPAEVWEAAVKYMLLICTDRDAYAKLDEATQAAVNQDYWTYTQAIIESKEMVAGDPLQGPETATTVQVKDGKRLTTDGPFAETKEALGGYYVVDVADLDRALELAATLPGAKRGFDKIEVRPIMELPPDFAT
jgi:hypothetical protein